MIYIGQYEPIVKSKNYCPNPVAKHGIPPYADSIANPKVKGTPAWREWWMEQIRRCIFGYHTGGSFIPGRLYYYLNHCYMTTVGKGRHHPMVTDLDIQFFDAVEYAKKKKKGIIGVKARRKGFSFRVDGGVIDYGFHFNDKYEAGICAGLEEHSLDFLRKFEESMTFKRPEMQMHLLKDNNDIKIAGWTIKSPTGWKDEGTKNTLYIETMFNNPGKFKGKKLEDAVFEESGEFDLLLEAYEATKPCFMDGEYMVGTPYIYGTGGNIKSSSKGFKEMWHNAESFNLIKLSVMADRMFFPCVAGWEGSGGEKADIPYLEEKYPDPETRIGMEDTRRAREKILQERKVKEQNPNKKAYFEHLQNYPLDDMEAFMSFASNRFDTEILNTQLYHIDELDVNKWGKYHLDYKTDSEGKLLYPLEVEARPLKDTDKSDCFLMIHKQPMSNYKDLDVAGIDSYDMDESDTSKSLGSMVVYRRTNAYKDVDGGFPIALIYCRPKRKEDFYELCFKTAIYYNLLKNVNVDAEKSLVIQYFKDSPGGTKYLAKRPRSLESEHSKQTHDYGTKLTLASKPKMLAMLQTWVVDHAHKCWFRDIVMDLLTYDVEAKESDWDSADALGLALIRDVDMKYAPRKTDVTDTDPYRMPEYREVGDNIVVSNTPSDVPEDIKDPFIRMIWEGRLR